VENVPKLSPKGGEGRGEVEWYEKRGGEQGAYKSGLLNVVLWDVTRGEREKNCGREETMKCVIPNHKTKTTWINHPRERVWGGRWDTSFGGAGSRAYVG